MLSKLVFSQQFLCFPSASSQIQYEVTRACQPCWVFGTEARPIACILLLTDQGLVRQVPPRLNSEVALMTLSQMSETARIVIVNLLFTGTITYEARLADGLSMSDSVVAGGSLATKIYLDKVRAFELVIQSDKTESKARWTFCADGIVCRPRALKEEEEQQEKVFKFLGGAGPIRSVFADDAEIQSSRPLAVRIQINSALAQDQMLNDADSIMASALSLANCMTANVGSK